VAALTAKGGLHFTGTIIATMLSSYLDSKFLFPLMRGDSETPSRLQDIAIQTVSEGSPMTRFYGPLTRIPGQLIWADSLQEIRDSGGKGFAAQDKPLTSEVRATFAVAFGEGRWNARPKAMWADEKLIWNEELPGPLDISSADYEIVQKDVYRVGILGTLTWTHGFLQVRTVGVGSSSDPLLDYPVGTQLRLGGLKPNTFQNADWRDDVYDPTGTTSRLITVLSAEVGISAKAELTLDVRNEGPLETDYDRFLPQAAGGGLTTTSQVVGGFEPFDTAMFPDGGVTWYPGTDNASASPVIEAVEGVGNVEAYRGVAYAVFENLIVNDFGNRIPNITAIWENVGLGRTPGTYTYKHAIADLLDRSLGGDEYDLTGLDVVVGSSTVGVPEGNIYDSAPKISGFFVRGPQEPTKMMQPLFMARQMIAQEKAGVLHFMLRKNAETVTIDPDDLAAHEHGAEYPSAFTMRDDAESSVPSNLEIKFIDEDRDLQQGHERERTASHVFEDVRVIELPITMTSDDARDLALSHLWTLHANRRKVGPFFLPPRYLHLAEGDRVEVPIGGETWTALVTKVDRGENLLLEVEGMIEEEDTLQFSDA
jgi:hypothetical protein